MKTLKQLLELKKPEVPTPSAPIEPDSITALVPKTKDEKRFMDKHVVQKKDDIAGNTDDVYRAANIKAYDRTASRHGYNTKDDQAVYEDTQPKSLKQVLGQLDEAAAHDQYNAYHASVKDTLKKLGTMADAHKEASMSPTEYNSTKGSNMHIGHVYAMKTLHRTLQDMHDSLQQDVEHAKPPKPIKMREETGLFEVFAEDVRTQVQEVFDSLNEENQQLMIEMIEAQEYDAIVDVVKEIVNG